MLDAIRKLKKRRMEIMVKISAARVSESVSTRISKLYRRDVYTCPSSVRSRGFCQYLASMFLSLILACGLVPVVSVDDRAHADTVVDSIASSVQEAGGEVIIVYEDEALGLDENINPNARSAGTTLQDVGVVDQE